MTTALKALAYKIPEDVIFHISKERLIATNVFARTHVEINDDLVRLTRFLFKMRSLDDILEFIQNCNLKLAATDRTIFSNKKGLLADPTNLEISQTSQPQTQWEEVLKLFLSRFILIQDEKKYRGYFKAKDNVFDNDHFGNFHQQLGFNLRLLERVDPDLWWVEQKYRHDEDALGDNLYKHIQLYFYERFFTPERIRGKRVLDVGCGTGFYSRLLARQGATVLGIDPNGKHIQRAKSLHTEGLRVEYRVVDIASGSALENLASDSFDLIFFQDALMFYFVPYGNQPLTTCQKVLSELKRCLKKNGSFWVIEPHGMFWLSPWFGSDEYPFSVITEYAHKTYGVTPTLEQLSAAFEDAGLLIKRIHELEVSEKAQKDDVRAFSFSREFPQWWAFELVKGGES